MLEGPLPVEELRDDFEIVMGAVSQDGRWLQHTSERLRGNREIVYTAESTVHPDDVYACHIRAAIGLRDDYAMALHAVRCAAVLVFLGVHQQVLKVGA